MTREAAVADLRRLRRGLPADDRGMRKLLERVSEHQERELLRDVLIEEGARHVLEVAPA